MHEDEVEKGGFVSSHNITLKHFSTSHALAFCWSWSRLKCTHSQRTNTHCHVEDIKWGLWECVTWIRHCPRLSTSFGKIKNERKCLLRRIDAFPRKIPRRVKIPVYKAFWGWDETSVLVAHKTHPLKAICKGARWKMMVLKVTFFHCFGFFIHLCWWSQTINYMPSGQLISCLIEPQSSSQGCYMALWRCSSSIELLFFVPHTSIACV